MTIDLHSPAGLRKKKWHKDTLLVGQLHYKLCREIRGTFLALIDLRQRETSRPTNPEAQHDMMAKKTPCRVQFGTKHRLPIAEKFHVNALFFISSEIKLDRKTNDVTIAYY